MLNLQTTWERVTSPLVPTVCHGSCVSTGFNSEHGMSHINSQKVVYEKNQSFLLFQLFVLILLFVCVGFGGFLFGYLVWVGFLGF